MRDNLHATKLWLMWQLRTARFWVYYAASSNLLPTFRDNLSVPSSGF